tara:strand:- start:7507 stop:7980 length:474 start_codon:yes stop_codon:yes gene_type:complete
MKKIIIILSLLFSINLHSQSIVAPSHMDEEEMVLSYRALKTFIGDSNLVVMFHPYYPLHPNIEGLTFQFHKNLYSISISHTIENKKIRKWVLLHEIGHVIDLHKERLKQDPPTWEGEPINPTLHWNERPWEKSAEKWATLMWLLLVEDTPPIRVYVD